MIHADQCRVVLPCHTRTLQMHGVIWVRRVQNEIRSILPPMATSDVLIGAHSGRPQARTAQTRKAFSMLLLALLLIGSGLAVLAFGSRMAVLGAGVGALLGVGIVRL